MSLSEAHIRARLGNTTPQLVEPNEHTRYASVAAVLRMDAAPEVLLIQRAKQEGDRWSGHMAFPGGMRDEEDVDLLAAAVRETEEELALKLDRQTQYVGRLNDVQAIARGERVNLVIVPHVFIWSGAADLVPNPDEVAAALWAPVLPMMQGELNTIRPYVHEGRDMKLPAYQVGPHVIWGLTHQMLQLLFEAIKIA